MYGNRYGSSMYGGGGYGSSMYGGGYGSSMYGGGYGSSMYGGGYGSSMMGGGMYGRGMNFDPNNPSMMDKSMMFLDSFSCITNSLCESARYIFEI